MAALALSLLGCGNRVGGPSSVHPILLLAVDGLEWRLVLPMAQSGDLPELGRLMDEGVYGRLRTTRPTFSPIIWTSIATGRLPTEHGIRGFVRRREGRRRLFNRYDRKTKAFWNILTDYGRKVGVVGWWMTFPAEEIDGVMVAQVNTLDQVRSRRVEGRAILKGGLVKELEGQVHPPERLAEFLEIHDRVSAELPERMLEIFGFEEPQTPLTRRLWENTGWSLRSDATYLEITERLADEGLDLLACYLGGTDVVAHRFWRYMEPGVFEHPPTADEVERFGNAIRDYYRYIDSWIGRLRARMPAETRVVVVSDHGMRASNRSQRFDSHELPEDLNSAHHHGAPPGVLIASGPGIEAGQARGAWRDLELADLEETASIFDVLPTLLALLEVPLGEDLAGRPLVAVGEPTVATVASHDDSDWQRLREDLQADRLGRDEEGRMEQLKALGYIE